ncbi:hypothetical protein [Flavobacterium sp.]|uniref:hypothetical protein n=1 Tax=Flavobacterium sp. TaxID=239 RepID=UPI0040473466
MKKIIIIQLLLLSISSFGQENCTEINVKYDEVTDKTTISSERIQYDGFSMVLFVGERKGIYPKMVFKTDKDTCIDEYQSIYILFHNGERIKIANYVYNYNCDGLTGFIINTRTNKKLLENEKIKSIRIDTRNSYLQTELNEEQANQIIYIINCAYNRKSWEEQIRN